MTAPITELIEKIRALEGELDAELAKRSAEPSCASASSMAASLLKKNCCAATVSCARSCCPI
jgi:hypothetical protein